jgi:hypothetical protein
MSSCCCHCWEVGVNCRSSFPTMPAVRSQKRHVGSFGGFFLGIFVKKITALSWAGMKKRTRLDLIFSS